MLFKGIMSHIYKVQILKKKNPEKMQDDHFVLCIVSVPKPIGLSFTGTNISGSRTASLYGISQLLLWLVHAYLDILKKSARGTYSKFIKLIQNRGDPESLKRGHKHGKSYWPLQMGDEKKWLKINWSVLKLHVFDHRVLIRNASN